MKKLLANVTYSFNSFYSNLNVQGQMIFSIITLLIILLCIILLVAKIIDKVQKRKNHETEIVKQEPVKIEETKIEEKEPLYTNEKTEIEDIASAISSALEEEEKPINLTNFEEEQEKTAIISINELMDKAKELELIDDEETGVNYLEKFNLESALEPKEEQEVKAFKVSQVISPIYGVRKEVVSNEEKESF